MIALLVQNEIASFRCVPNAAFLQAILVLNEVSQNLVFFSNSFLKYLDYAPDYALLRAFFKKADYAGIMRFETVSGTGLVGNNTNRSSKPQKHAQTVVFRCACLKQWCRHFFVLFFSALLLQLVRPPGCRGQIRRKELHLLRISIHTRILIISRTYRIVLIGNLFQIRKYALINTVRHLFR